MTYCPQVWDGFYINRFGDVYPCCVQKPWIVGNIKESTLKEILNGSPMIEARRASLNRTLPCYQKCTLLDKSNVKKYSVSAEFSDYSMIRRLHISFGEACNIRCEMCSHPIRHANNPIFLDPETVIRNVEISSIQDFVIQGGEPLFIRQCLDYMNHLEKIGKKYTILTNGLLINDGMAERLALNAKVVSISLNGATKATHEKVNRGSDFERVLSNILKLKHARKGLATQLTIFGRMTITTDNLEEVPMFIRSYNNLGFDRINFGFVKETVPEYLHEHRDLFSNLRNQVSSALEAVDLSRADILRLRQLNLIDGRDNLLPSYYSGGYAYEMVL